MEIRPEDRGWNDPPIVNFNESNQGFKRGKLLNKRVAFPINASVGGSPMGAGYPSMQTSPVMAPGMQAPPMPVNIGQESYMFNSSQNVPGGSSYYPQSPNSYYPQQQSHVNEYPQQSSHQVPASYMTSDSVEQPQSVQFQQQNANQSVPLMANDSMQQLDEAVRNFYEIVNTLAPQTVNKDEISKQLQMLESMWREQRLNQEVQSIVFQLSLALRNGDGNYANNLLQSLNANHTDSCHEWIAGPQAMLQAIYGQGTGI